MDKHNIICDEYYAREIVFNSNEASTVEKETRRQADSNLWYHHNGQRLTASNFCSVAKRKATTPVANTVKTLLYSQHVEMKALRWGHTHEVMLDRHTYKFCKNQIAGLPFPYLG